MKNFSAKELVEARPEHLVKGRRVWLNMPMVREAFSRTLVNETEAEATMIDAFLFGLANNHVLLEIQSVEHDRKEALRQQHERIATILHVRGQAWLKSGCPNLTRMQVMYFDPALGGPWVTVDALPNFNMAEFSLFKGQPLERMEQFGRLTLMMPLRHTWLFVNARRLTLNDLLDNLAD